MLISTFADIKPIFYDANIVLKSSCFCGPHFKVLDVGANIGLTSIALANICNTGKVVAIEPVPRAFQFLEENISNAQLNNVKIVNVAVGEKDSRVMMQGKNDFLAGSFIAERYQADSEHFLSLFPCNV